MGNPVSAEVNLSLLLAPRLSKEGESEEIESSSYVIENGRFWKALKSNQVYYACMAENQDIFFSDYYRRSLNNWEGIEIQNHDGSSIGDKLNIDLQLSVYSCLIEKAD